METWTRTEENAVILFLLLPFVFGNYWGFLWLKNKIMGFNITDVYAIIYKDPLAAAILRVGTQWSVVALIWIVYGRIV